MAKPTVAYLWARTVRCKGCRATVPLLKTRWLCKKDNKRVLLTMTPNSDRTGVVFGVEAGVPQARGNAAQRREHDKRLGAGTMSRSGARCPCCPRIMTMEDIRLEGRDGRLGAEMTAVVVDGPKGKEYRLPKEEELRAAEVSPDELDALYADIPSACRRSRCRAPRTGRLDSVERSVCWSATASTNGPSCSRTGNACTQCATIKDNHRYAVGDT